MSIKDSVRPTWSQRVLRGISFVVVFLVLLSGGAFMLSGWFFAGADSSVEGRTVGLLMGLFFWGMAALSVYAWRRGWKKWPTQVAEQIGVPDTMKYKSEARSKENIPNALQGQSPPNDALIVAGSSVWYSRVLAIVILGIGAGLFYFGWNVQTIFPGWHVSASYLLMGFGGLLLIIGLNGLRPRYWHGCYLGFIAIPEGIYLHGQGKNPEGHEWSTPKTRWLFVPWANVVDVREGLVFMGGGQGGATWWPSIKVTLNVTPDEAREWFPYAENEPGDDGTNRVVSLDYSNSDSSPKETAARLQRLWESK